jgi:MYXO-CTERM domain-containing protein
MHASFPLPWSALLLAGLALSLPAHAREDGITGYSGKSGVFCNACHTGGSQPTVVLTGPTSVTANSTHTYVLTITGGSAEAGGLNAAVDVDDAIMGARGELRVQNNEVTHSDEQNFSNGSLALSFTVRAPPRNGPFRIFAAGNSTNDDGDPTGDRAGATALTVEVSGGIDPPDGGAPPPPPPGTLPPEPEPLLEDEPTNGCSATGGPALLLALLLLAGAGAHQRYRRRRR